MAKYINIDQLFKCETCRYHYYGGCDTWCDHGEAYRPAMSELKVVDAEEVVRCRDCKHSREINRTKLPEKYFSNNCIVCECEDVVGDEPMVYLRTHFCSYGERGSEE